MQGLLVWPRRKKSAAGDDRRQLEQSCSLPGPQIQVSADPGMGGQGSKNRGSSSRPIFLGGHKQSASRLCHQGPRVMPSTVFIHVGVGKERASPSVRTRVCFQPVECRAAGLLCGPLGSVWGGMKWVLEEQEGRCCKHRLRSDPGCSQQGPQAGCARAHTDPREVSRPRL